MCAAPKGNLFAAGHGWGRPAKYETPEEFELAIDTFIKKSIKRRQYKPTVSGLAFFLGFKSKQSMYDYEGSGEVFSYLVHQARLFIESCYEAQLYSTSPGGAQFALSNMGWKNKTETDITTNGKDINPVDLSKLSLEELQTLQNLTEKAKEKQ